MHKASITRGACGVGTEIYYPLALHLQPCFAELGYRVGAFPHAERATAEVLALPIYAELTEAQQAYVVERIAAFYSDGNPGRVPKPSRDAALPARPAGSTRASDGNPGRVSSALGTRHPPCHTRATRGLAKPSRDAALRLRLAKPAGSARARQGS